jgi:hypothetical protein
MAMQDFQPMHHDCFVHSNRKREIVRGILEEWIASYIHFVKEHVRKKLGQPERLPICNEMDLVASRSERDAELRRHGA